MTGIVYKNAPQNVFHSWVEVNFEDKWYELEAFILDMEYLRKMQRKIAIVQVHFVVMVWQLKTLKIRLLILIEIIHIFRVKELIKILESMIRLMTC